MKKVEAQVRDGHRASASVILADKHITIVINPGVEPRVKISNDLGFDAHLLTLCLLGPEIKNDANYLKDAGDQQLAQPAERLRLCCGAPCRAAPGTGVPSAPAAGSAASARARQRTRSSCPRILSTTSAAEVHAGS